MSDVSIIQSRITISADPEEQTTKQTGELRGRSVKRSSSMNLRRTTLSHSEKNKKCARVSTQTTSSKGKSPEREATSSRLSNSADSSPMKRSASTRNLLLRSETGEASSAKLLRSRSASALNSNPPLPVRKVQLSKNPEARLEGGSSLIDSGFTERVPDVPEEASGTEFSRDETNALSTLSPDQGKTPVTITPLSSNSDSKIVSSFDAMTNAATASGGASAKIFKKAADKFFAALEGDKPDTLMTAFEKLEGRAKKLPPHEMRQLLSEQLGNIKPLGDRQKTCFQNFTAIAERAGKRASKKNSQKEDVSRKLSGFGFGKKKERQIKPIQAPGTAAGGVLTALKEAAKEIRLRDIRNALGPTIEVDDEGFVSCRATNVEIPKRNTEGLELPSNHQAFTPAAFIEARAATVAMTHVKPLNHIPIAAKAVADWPRIDFVFADEKGDIATKDQELTDILGDIAAFLGGPQFLSALSRVLHQTEIAEIICQEANPGHDAAVFRPAPREGNKIVVTHDKVESYGDTNQLASANFKVRKEGDNFRVSISHMLLLQKEAHDNLPVGAPLDAVSVNSNSNNSNSNNNAGGDNALRCLKVDLQGELLISGKAAAEGRVEIDPASTVTKTYSGSFAMPQ